MTFYAFDITVPAGTTEAAPVTQTLKLTAGIITDLTVKFAPGVHSLVKVRILRSEFQLVPLSRGEWVTGDGEPVKAEDYYDLTEVPTDLKFVACSPLTSYSHVITVRVTITPSEVAAPWRILDSFVNILKHLFRI